MKQMFLKVLLVKVAEKREWDKHKYNESWLTIIQNKHHTIMHKANYVKS